jgi:hypothetical protein
MTRGSGRRDERGRADETMPTPDPTLSELPNSGGPSGDTRPNVIYGVDTIDPRTLIHPLAGLADTPEEWRIIFDKSLKFISGFLSAASA